MKHVSKQFTKFAIIGIANTALDLLIYVVLTRLIPYFEEHYLLAAAVAFLIAGVNGFYWNRRWTFRDKSAITSKILLKFYMASGMGLIVNELILWYVVESVGSDIIAKLLGSAGAAVVSFAFQRLWTFRHVHPRHGSES